MHTVPDHTAAQGAPADQLERYAERVAFLELQLTTRDDEVLLAALACRSLQATVVPARRGLPKQRPAQGLS